MAGKQGMHKRSLNPAAAERIRDRIQSDRIINKLENHILDGVEMTSTQVSAALGLLKKKLPDLSSIDQAVEHTGKVAHDVEIRIIDNPS
jgi:hypothetical protein